ncbi:MAG: hypothetical protein LQ340_001318, partial [Diploschistes diacapsis]
MHFSLFVATAALAAVAAAAPTAPASHVVHEKRDALPRNWVKRSRLEGNVKLPMRVGLTQSNLHKGDDLLMEVSRHDSPKFGQWYSAEEVIELFAPAKKSVDTVRNWLESAGVEAHRISQSANKQWMQFDATPEEVEDILKTEYYVYEHGPTGKTHVGCDQYHVPAHVKEHVDYVTPGLRLLSSGKKSRKADGELEKRGFRTSSNQKFSGPVIKGPLPQQINGLPNSTLVSMCDEMVTPVCIATMYNITQATKAAAGNQLGIFEEGDFYAAEDLVEFFAMFAPNIPATTKPILEGIDGGTAPMATAGGESDLDFQISYPIIYPQNSILFQTDDLPYATGEQSSSGFLNTFLDAIDGSYCTYSAFGETGNSRIDPKYPDPNPAGYKGQLQCGVYKPTHVISISYGEQEDDLPTNYQQRQCSEFMKLGMQGTSVIFASGDSGVSARGADDGNGDGCLGNGEVFNPDFSASCPYVTALGATYLPPGASAVGDHEVAVTRFPSGGGFSNIYPAPSYQASAVANYFATSNPPYKFYNTSGTNNPSESVTAGGVYNRGGRGYPDFAAIGDNVVVVINGTPELIGGTSAAAPTFAAILNRINEERIAAGKSTVGFVNPTLYANPQVLHDITVGNNSGCGTSGFFAAKGWDPVTGLGTPNYPAMLSLYM